MKTQVKFEGLSEWTMGFYGPNSTEKSGVIKRDGGLYHIQFYPYFTGFFFLQTGTAEYHQSEITTYESLEKAQEEVSRIYQILLNSILGKS